MDKRAWSWPVVAGTTLLAWLSAFIGGVALLATPAFLAVLAWLLRRRRWRPSVVLLLTSPFALASGLATFTYARGVAHLWTSGLPGPGFYNVDPSTRYQSTSSGCLVNGSEWVLELPNNVTLFALHSVFGPMPGAYDGPYPQNDDIKRALAGASPLNWPDLERDTIKVGGTLVRLRNRLGSHLTTALRPAASGDADAQPSIALWRERVLLLGFPSPLAQLDNDAPLVVLIDRATGKVIAYKGRMPVYMGRLPMQWT